MKILRVIGILVIATLLVIPVSGCSGQAQALAGAIESLSPDGTTIVIDGQELTINGDTEITGTLAEGTVIEVKFVVQDDGSLLAVEIEVENDEDDLDDDQDIDEDMDDEDFELEGTIESINTDNTTGDITSIFINSQEILINQNTEIEGTLSVNATVEVEVTVQPDGSLLALEVEIEDDEDADDEDFELEGTIESVTDNTSIVVDGLTFFINGDSEIEGILAANATVEVEYVIQNDGSYLAIEIEVEEADDEDDLDDDDEDRDDDVDNDTDKD